MIRKIIVVAPKWESLRFKNDDERTYVMTVMRSEINKLGVSPRDITCFYEDVLAKEALAEIDGIQPIRLLSANDANNYLRDYVLVNPEEYWICNTVDAPTDLRRESLKKYRPVRAAGLDDYIFVNKRNSVLLNRMRYVAERLLKADYCKAVIYFENGTNYCRCPVPELGDGLLISNVSVAMNKSKLPRHSFGGIDISEDNREQILKGMIGK